jgi:class 3 adenylate cyclase
VIDGNLSLTVGAPSARSWRKSSATLRCASRLACFGYVPCAVRRAGRKAQRVSAFAPTAALRSPPAVFPGIALGNRFKAPASTRHVKGERRHITVLFSDLVNSTRLVNERDPEEWLDIAMEYRRAAAEAVLRLGGYLAQYLGDGLIAYFGWPTAERRHPTGVPLIRGCARRESARNDLASVHRDMPWGTAAQDRPA